MTLPELMERQQQIRTRLQKVLNRIQELDSKLLDRTLSRDMRRYLKIEREDYFDEQLLQENRLDQIQSKIAQH